MKLGIKILNTNRIINWMIFLVSLVVSLFLAELVMRWVYSEYDPRGNVMFYSKNDGTVLAKPNFSGRQWRNSGEFNVKVDINKYGFRERKDFKNAQSKDLFLIGDSFSFGHGVEEEERFGNVLQKLFLGKSKVYNNAISVSHFINYQRNLEYAENQGTKIENILIGVCMENDILDYDKVLKEWETQIIKEDEISIKNWLNQKSCLYNFLAVKIQSNQNVRIFLTKIGIVKNASRVQKLEATEQELKSSLEQLKIIIRGKKSLVVLIPSRMNWVQNQNQVEIANKTHENFKYLLRKNEILFVDMKPVFNIKSDNPLEELHFKYDGHWNKQGHQLAANAIFDEWLKIESSDVLKTPEDSIFIERFISK